MRTTNMLPIFGHEESYLKEHTNFSAMIDIQIHGSKCIFSSMLLYHHLTILILKFNVEGMDLQGDTFSF